MSINEMPQGSNLTLEELNSDAFKLNTSEEIAKIAEKIKNAIKEKHSLEFTYLLYDAENKPVYKLEYSVMPKMIIDNGQTLLCSEAECVTGVSAERAHKVKMFYLKGIKNLK